MAEREKFLGRPDEMVIFVYKVRFLYENESSGNLPPLHFEGLNKNNGRVLRIVLSHKVPRENLYSVHLFKSIHDKEPFETYPQKIEEEGGFSVPPAGRLAKEIKKRWGRDSDRTRYIITVPMKGILDAGQKRFFVELKEEEKNAFFQNI